VVVLSTQIFQSTRQGFVPEYGEASAFAVVLVVLVGVALIPYYRITGGARRFSTISGKGFRATRIELGGWRYAAGAWMLLMPLFLLAPIAMMGWASLLRYYTPPTPEALGLLTADNYPAALVFPNLQAAIRTSVVASLGSATVVALMAVVVAWAIARGGSALGGVVDFLASVPLVFPGIVLGLAVMQMFLALPIPIYGTVGILIFAFVIRYLPYGMRYAHPAVLAINPELEEAARTSGAGTSTVLGRVVLPLALPSLAALWIYVVLISVRELSMSVLLSGAQTPVVSLAILELWQSGQITVVAAFSCMLVVVLTALALVFLRLTRRYGFHG
jgi:iron(III) transport system permease protein